MVSASVQRLENFAAAPGTILGVKAFELDLKAPNGTELQPAKPVTLEWVVSAQALAYAGGNRQNVLLLYFNPATRKWEADAAVSMSGNTATFVVKHFSTYAFAVRVAGAITTPAPPQVVPTTAPSAPGAVTPATGAGGALAGTAAGPGITPRPANTGTGIPAQDPSRVVLPIALAVLGLGILGGVGLRTARRRA